MRLLVEPDEVADLSAKVESQQKHIDQLVEQKDAYEAQMIALQQEIIKAGSEAFRSILDK